jgi:tRNA(Ile)-lysidine synthase
MNKQAVGGLEARFTQAWQQLAPKKLRAGVLVAVSGGLDSMVLVHLVHQAGIWCGVAHVNFGLRGEASDADEMFVRDWAENRELPFHTIRFDTKAEAALRRTGIQETARDLRYSWFEHVRAANDYSAVLTAHHADDNAETFLLNLFRGAGLTGLGGIPPKSGKVLRPFLAFRKSELEDFARIQGISFHEDASNATSDYLRNAVRHTAIPALSGLFPNAGGTLAETAVRLRETAIIYEPALRRQLKSILDVRGPDTYVSIRALRKAEPFATLAHEIFSPAGFTSAQLPHILALIEAQTGRFIDTDTHRVLRHREHLVITPRNQGEAEILVVESLPATLKSGVYKFDFIDAEPPATFSDDSAVAWIDVSSLNGPLILRRGRAGDYFYPLGMGHKKKKVTRFLTALKVPRHEKDAAWVLESGGRIAWVAGYRIDERFKLTSRTEKALRVQRSLIETAA